MTLIRRELLFLVLATVGGLLPASGEEGLRVAPLFRDGLVLQRERPVPIWGWDVPGRVVNVEFSGQKKQGMTDAQGRWKVVLDPMKAAFEPRTLNVEDTFASIQVQNILIGDVWLCAGQSNMGMSLRECREENGSADLALRIFTVGRNISPAPERQIAGAWLDDGEANRASFSAVAWYFGREMRAVEKVPIGLIVAAVGATRAETWMSPEALAADRDFAWAGGQYEEFLRSTRIEQEFSDFRSRFGVYWRAMSPAESERMDPSGRLQELYKLVPSGLYHAMICPLAPFGLRGVIWYQGESNASRASVYRRLLPALISDWRKLWGEELPFYLVQLPRIRAWAGWLEIREAQYLTSERLPHVSLVVCGDLGNPEEIHPKDKDLVGARIVETVRSSKDSFSPAFRPIARVSGSQIRLSFPSGVAFRKTSSPASPFWIAGENRIFYPANWIPEGDSVRIWTEQVSSPVALRYGWSDDPTLVLWTRENLPISPFRTDAWPILTDQPITEARNSEEQMRRIVDDYLLRAEPEGAALLLRQWQGSHAALERLATPVLAGFQREGNEKAASELRKQIVNGSSPEPSASPQK